jgi:hypothetical protein
MNIAALHSINDFFDKYALAWGNFDSKLMATYYSIPCSLLSDEGNDVFTEASRLEGFFNQGAGFYKQYGIAHVRPEVWSKRTWSNKIAKVKVNWQYFDAKNTSLYNCDYQYILKLDKNNQWKIEVSVSVNEKEKMEEWISKSKK